MAAALLAGPIGQLIALTSALAWEPPYPGRWAGNEIPGPIPLPVRALSSLALASPVEGRRYRLDGFEIGETDPLPLPFAALAAAEVISVAPVADRLAVPAVLVQGITVSGSNKWEADGILIGARDEVVAGATVAGPIAKDRLWYAATVEGGAEARALAKLTWQVTARQKLGLLWTEAGEGGRLVGLTSDSLLRDDMVARVQLAAGDRPQGSVRVDYFGKGFGGEHNIGLGGRGLLADPDAATLFLEDHWRPTRHLTVAPVLAWSGGLVPGVGLAWDATHDGRTVVRASASSRWPRVSLGAARELSAGLVASLDLLERTLAVALRKREGGPVFDLAYARAVTGPDPHHLRASAAFAWASGLSLGAFLTAERQVWAGLRTRFEIGGWLGFPLAVSIDAVGLPARADVRLWLQTRI